MAKGKREFVWLQCECCNRLNYRVERTMAGANRLKLKKYCKWDQKHTLHVENRKK